MLPAQGISSRKVFPSKDPIIWQWEHRTGFRDYDDATSRQIEKMFQSGNAHMRIKAGKLKSTPMEIFFEDMIQHDPITGNMRKVRREGPDSLYQWARRTIYGFYQSMETGRPRRMKFSQYNKMRHKHLQNLDQRETNESDLYHTTGCCASVARSTSFGFLTMLIVIANSLWLGVDANFNDAATIWSAKPIYQIMEHFFGVSFILELIIRFCAFRRKRDCFKDNWFIFDFLLVVMLVGETWVMLPVWLAQGANSEDRGIGHLSILRVARLLRLTRLGRVARLLRFVPEVVTLLKGITLALRSVFLTLMVLLVVTYLFGIIFKTQAEPLPNLSKKFNGVYECMWWLLLHGTFLDAVADELPAVREESPMLTFLFLVFVFLSSFTVLNMLIGIVCDVVTTVHNKEKEQAAQAYLKRNLLNILEVHDKNDDRNIRKDEFELLMRNPEIHMILSNFGVDAEDLVSLKDILFENKERFMDNPLSDNEEGETPKQVMRDMSSGMDDRKISFGEFLELVLRLRGGNGATVRDVVDLREYVRTRIDHLELRLPGEPRPFADGPVTRWPTSSTSSLGFAGPRQDWGQDGMDAVLAQFAEITKDMQEMRQQIVRLESAHKIDESRH